MLPTRVRDYVAETFRSVVDEVVSEHYPALTQEHQLTARIGQALESEFRDLDILGYRFFVISQDIPDRGRGSLESRLGADLFLSISLSGAFSKGMLIQSKWKDSHDGRVSEQCLRMSELTKASYAWIFGPSGARTLPARYVGKDPNAIRSRWAWNIGVLMRKVLDCKAGDPDIGVNPGPNARAQLGHLLAGLDAAAGIAVHIVRPEEVLPIGVELPHTSPTRRISNARVEARRTR